MTSEDLLRAILAELKKVHRELADMRLIYEATSEGRLAPESDHEDPVVHCAVNSWKGPSFKGAHYSQCDPHFLDKLARQFEFFAGKEEREGTLYKGKPTAPLTWQKAARARRWALRIRLGQVIYTAPATPAASSFDDVGGASFPTGDGFGAPAPAADNGFVPDDDEIPF